VNHFPNSHELTRKDKLAFNIKKMQNLFGKEEYNIAPDTYVIPDEFSLFYA
jgi:hypothetical protein